MSIPYTKYTEQGSFRSYSFGTFTPGVGWSNSTSYGPHNTWVNSLIGYKNPKWRDQVAAQTNATTPMTGYRWGITRGSAHMEANGIIANNDSPWNQWYYRRGVIHTGSLRALEFGTLPADSTEAISEASGKFFKAAHQALRTLQGGAMMGELKKTTKMIKDRSGSMLGLFKPWENGLKKAMSRARRGKNLVEHLTKAANSLYLEFTYGWSPLAGDVRSLLQGLEKDFVETEIITARSSRSTATSTQSTSGFAWLTWYNTLKEVKTFSVEYKGAVKATRSGLGGIAESFGVMPHDFLPTIYELMPWSFFLDYFTNLGDMIEAVSFPITAFAWSSGTTRSTVERQYYSGHSANPGGGWKSISVIAIPERSVTRYTRVNRNVISKPPFPFPVFKVPGFGSKQWLNIGALAAAQAFGQRYSHFADR